MAQVLASQIKTLSDVMPGIDRTKRHRAAIGSWFAMVGALILSRSIDDPALSAELLSETQAWIKERTTPGQGR